MKALSSQPAEVFGKAAKPARLLRFSAEQRRDLKNLRVTDFQMKELEARFSLCRAYLREDAPINTVRKEFKAYRKAMASALDAARKLSAASPIDDMALSEVSIRIATASVPIRGEGSREGLIHCLEVELLSIDGAVKDSRISQTRSNSASVGPVALIADALSGGWANDPGRDLRKPEKFVHSPSSSPGGTFRTIVGLCYDVINDTHGSDPEKAIKTFVKRELTRKKRWRAKHGFGEAGDDFL